MMMMMMMMMMGADHCVSKHDALLLLRKRSAHRAVASLYVLMTKTERRCELKGREKGAERRGLDLNRKDSKNALIYSTP